MGMEDKPAGGKPPMSKWRDVPANGPARANNEMEGRNKVKAVDTRKRKF